MPKRGTVEWTRSKQTKLGGCEIAGVIGKSVHQTASEILARKKTTKNKPRPDCSFGRLMETVARMYIERTGTTVHKLGPIQANRYPVCYASDGIVIEGDELRLVEIKCPFKRSDTANIPEYYLPQIQTGMCILPCDETLFYQMRIRLCSIADLGWSAKYNRWVHSEGFKRCKSMRPLTWGYIHIRRDCPVIDVGGVGKPDSGILCGLEKKRYRVFFECRDIPDYGLIIGFKLFNNHRHRIKKDKTFLDSNAKKLWDAHVSLVVQRDE